MSWFGGSSSPSEDPDSLKSVATAKLLFVISEGEIDGIVDDHQNIYLDGTPLQNPDGSYNFINSSSQRPTVDFRPGTRDQEYIQGFPDVENEITIGVALTSATPWVRGVTDLDLSAVRIRLGLPSLLQSDPSSGDIHGYHIDYMIELAVDGGAYQTVLQSAFDGKQSGIYERSHRIDLPAAAQGWLIRLTRLTPNRYSSTVADTVNIESITEIIDAKLRYPNTALLGLQFDASMFQGMPTVKVRARGRKVLIPDNYDPVARTYAGVWQGTFKAATYTNNPAWIFYDMVVNTRYGLGKRVTPAMLDKWELYAIAQYCDQLVPDGRGGQEPRFTCNLQFGDRVDALQRIQDLASVFRGMAYWSGSALTAVADRPYDVSFVYTAANTVDGKFTYDGTDWNARHTVALVTWKDPTNMSKDNVEYVEDEQGILRYGVLQTPVVAVGCTSQGQAQRVGRWVLETNRTETDTISLNVGLDGHIPRPGMIIGILDPARAGRPNGGRIHAATSRTVTLDRVTTAHNGDMLHVNLPDGTSEVRTVSSAMVDDSGRQVVTLATPYSTTPAEEAVWVLEQSDLAPQLFRVIKVTRIDEATFQISGSERIEGKFPAVDDGTVIEAPPVTVIPPSVQAPPTGISLSSYVKTAQGLAVSTMVISWTKPDNAVTYSVYWQKDSGTWVYAGTTGATSIEVVGIYAGAYLARVVATNAMGVASIAAYSALTALQGKTTPPPVLTSLTAASSVFAINLGWTFPAGATDTQRTEMWYGTTSDFSTAVKLADYAYPQASATMPGLAAGVEFWFWGRLVDRSGNTGDFYPATTAAGVHGQSSSDASEILSYLTEQITATQLAAQLLATIESGGGAKTEVDNVVSQLAAMYTIKAALTANNRTYIAGIGVGVENNDGEIESQVLVAASRFAVIDPNGAAVAAPFVVQGGQVFMDSAFIEDAAIARAKIQDAAVGTAQIDDAAITNAKIGDAEITSAKIGTAQVDTLRIGPNAVTTQAAWGGLTRNQSVAYTSSGGTLCVLVNGLGGLQIDGSQLLNFGGASTSGGQTTYSSETVFTIIAPGQGTHIFTVNLGALPVQAASFVGCDFTILEFKR